MSRRCEGLVNSLSKLPSFSSGSGFSPICTLLGLFVPAHLGLQWKEIGRHCQGGSNEGRTNCWLLDKNGVGENITFPI